MFHKIKDESRSEGERVYVCREGLCLCVLLCIYEMGESVWVCLCSVMFSTCISRV